jgi:primosomal protein N' (replication factor Y)
VAAVQAALRERTYRPVMLRGVTGSGKTEVYLRAAEEALAQGRGVIYLVPEIGLTPLLSRRFAHRFGNRVAVLHSGLSRGQRQQHWQRVRRGEATVVLGARSALFAPVVRPGLFVVDEEQESSFKQDERPRYHARDLALVRARECGAVVLLGSATPSLESFHHARTGKYHLLELPRRVQDRPLARTEVVDMREEFRSRGVADPLSRRLESLLRAGLERGEQSLLLLNRRGYATFVLCRECGAAVSCPQCSVTLVLHRAEARLRCHHCHYWRRQPETCPACGSGHLHWGGEGTQRMEERLRARLEDVRMVRLDRDAVRRRGEAERILTGFDRGEWDVLLGTQMVAKGHDFSRVTLVGVLAAESTLCMPDFRAAERTFHLITQVVGRSGRGRSPGQAVIQTFQPQHYAIRHACEQDYLKFFEHEIRFRKLLQYPPFTVLANLIIARPGEDDACSQAQALAGELGKLGQEHVRVVGPAPAPLARLRGRFRFQILLKARARGRLLDVLRGALAAHRRQGHSERHVMVDMDPVSLL